MLSFSLHIFFWSHSYPLSGSFMPYYCLSILLCCTWRYRDSPIPTSRKLTIGGSSHLSFARSIRRLQKWYPGLQGLLNHHQLQINFSSSHAFKALSGWVWVDGNFNISSRFFIFWFLKKQRIKPSSWMKGREVWASLNLNQTWVGVRYKCMAFSHKLPSQFAHTSWLISSNSYHGNACELSPRFVGYLSCSGYRSNRSYFLRIGRHQGFSLRYVLK